VTQKKIFITIPWFLPAFRAGGPIQSVANLVREYDAGVAYYIFCGDVDLNGAALENVETDQWVGFNDHTQVWYNGTEKISDNLVKQVEAIKPDIIFIVGVFSWHYNIVPVMFCKGTRKILSARGMLHPGALSQKKWKKKIFLRFFKLLEYQYKVDFHATDEEEQHFITGHFGEAAKISIAGNFPNKIGKSYMPTKESGALKLVSIALISPMKNILPVLQALEKSVHKIEYNLYGPLKDEDYWEKCKEQAKKLPENIKFTWHKELEPQKVKEALRGNHVFVLPSKSENFGHAIYEALSAGRPVITSENTPWNELQSANAGMNISLDSSGSLENALDFFGAMDQEQMDQWSRGALNYAEKAVDVVKIRQQYDNLFDIR
jgi:glycosyltransferase involved in cell wall biosynthesis